MWHAAIGNVATGSLSGSGPSRSHVCILLAFIPVGTVIDLGVAAPCITSVGASVVTMTTTAASAVYSGIGDAAGGLRANVSADI